MKTLNPQAPQGRGNEHTGLSLRTAQTTPESNLFCQQNLTKSRFRRRIRSETNPLKMGLKNLGSNLGKMAAAVTMMASVDAKAETVTNGPEASEGEATVTLAASETSGAIEDCVGYVQEQRDLAAEVGDPLTRQDQKTMLRECRSGQLQERIVEQEVLIAELRAQLAAQDIEMDENAQILNELGEAIAEIITLNDQLIVRRTEIAQEIDQVEQQRAAVQAENERLIQRAEEILRGLVATA